MKYKVIELVENGEFIDSNGLLKNQINFLQKTYKNKISVEFLWQEDGNCVKLRAGRWVGFIPVTHRLALRIKPKIKLKNIFSMIAYIYSIYDFNNLLQKELMQCELIEDCFDVLANLLAIKVKEKMEKGLYRSYTSNTALHTYVRGKVDVQYAACNPWKTKLRCSYQELTEDVPDNQLLAWTLFLLSQNNILKDELLLIQKTYRKLRKVVTTQFYSSNDCVNRSYNRLNSDYKSLHALCQFLLESTGVSHESGNYNMLAFLVDMSSLFQCFVEEWLSRNLPPGKFLRKQEKFFIDKSQSIFFVMDLLIGEKSTDEISFVLDTKYKTELKTSDIQQILAYALAQGCTEAILIFPTNISKSLDARINGVRIRTLTFELDILDVQNSGKSFLEKLFQS